VITSYRNGSDPYASGQHRGIDIAAPVGATVVAAAGGEVRFAGTAGSLGLTIGIRTGDGYDTSYLHLSSLAVREGARVSAGDRIGAVGTTGTRSTPQPHLHLGIRDAGSRHAYHDPMSFLAPPAAAPRAPDPPPATVAEPAPAPPAAVPSLPGAAPAPLPRSAPVSGPEGGRSGARRPMPSPAPARVRAPGRAGARSRAPQLRTEPHPELSALPSSAPMQARAEQPARPVAAREARHPSGALVAEPASGHAAPAQRGAASVARLTRGEDAPARPGIDPSRPAPGGPNIGWALACAGLLLAAGVIGLTDGRSHSTGPGRHHRLGTTRRPRVASAVHAVLRHHAHLLRQR
jgi:hypothetical protein